MLQGHLLSCYTAGITTYMEQYQIDHQLALGTQLFLAIRFDRARPDQLVFVHYHTPLLGTHATHSLQMRRQCAARPEEAADRILEEYQRSGAVLVVGDTANLPWLVSYGHKHAPHWFVVAGVQEKPQTCLIIDPFAFIDEYGTQEPFTGTIDAQSLGGLAQATSVVSHAFDARNSWTFGTRERESIPVNYGYQWFEAVLPPQAYPVDDNLVYRLLHTTWLYQTGNRQRADLESTEWACGIASLYALATYCEEHLANPVLYQISDDLWVCARNRQMFAEVLQRMSKESGKQEFLLLAQWCEEHVAQQWHALPRIMHYNTGLLQRGRKPSMLLVDTLRSIAVNEAELMERLAVLLAPVLSVPIQL